MSLESTVTDSIVTYSTVTGIKCYYNQMSLQSNNITTNQAIKISHTPNDLCPHLYVQTTSTVGSNTPHFEWAISTAR